jgi:rhodanese-related sulfurtransferase
MLNVLRKLAASLASLVALSPGGPACAQQPTHHSATSQRLLSASEAHAASQAGDVVLIDIRTPEEWRQTGIPLGAHAINMHDDPRIFTQRLMAAFGGDRTRRIALICRTGNRSSHLQVQLLRAGFTNVVDVAEGMAGSRHGQGWLRSGLPTRSGSMASTPPSIPPRASAK